jgi:hypothetical protein
MLATSSTRITNPRLLSQTASYDAASTIYQSLGGGGSGACGAGGGGRRGQRRENNRTQRAGRRLRRQGLTLVPFSPVFEPLLSLKLQRTQQKVLMLNSVSGLVSKFWYRIPFDQSELSISKIPPTDSPKVRPGYDP